MNPMTALDATHHGTRRHEGTKKAFSQKHSLDSAVEDLAVEVQDQSDSELRNSQVRQHLSGVNRRQTFDAFHFDDDLRTDDQVRPMLAKKFAFVPERQRHLASELQARRSQLDA